MKAQAEDLFTDQARCEQEEIDETAWGDNFIQIGGSWPRINLFHSSSA